MNSPVRTSAIGLLQHLQLLYLPSELDITKYTKRVYPTFDCNQTPDPVLPTVSNPILGKRLTQRMVKLSFDIRKYAKLGQESVVPWKVTQISPINLHMISWKTMLLKRSSDMFWLWVTMKLPTYPDS
jgi:hypothetical protein